MPRHCFDSNLVYQGAAYLRRSSDQQNPSSLEQQLTKITGLLKALGHKWIIAQIYCRNALHSRGQQHGGN